MLLSPFLGPHVELLTWFKTFIGHKDDPLRPLMTEDAIPTKPEPARAERAPDPGRPVFLSRSPQYSCPLALTIVLTDPIATASREWPG